MQLILFSLLTIATLLTACNKRVLSYWGTFAFILFSLWLFVVDITVSLQINLAYFS